MYTESCVCMADATCENVQVLVNEESDSDDDNNK